MFAPFLTPSRSRFNLQCDCGLCNGLEVPQRAYVPVQLGSDAYQRDRETLSFSKGGCGVRLVDAVTNRLSGLVEGDDLMFPEAIVSTFSLRIEVSNRFGSSVGGRGVDSLI